MVSDLDKRAVIYKVEYTIYTNVWNIIIHLHLLFYTVSKLVVDYDYTLICGRNMNTIIDTVFTLRIQILCWVTFSKKSSALIISTLIYTHKIQ